MCGLQKGGRHRRGRRVVICLLGWGGEGRLGGLCASDVGGGQDKRAQAQGPNGHCGVKKALGLQPRSPIWGSEAVMGLQEHQKGRREKGPPGTRRNSQTYPGGNGYFFRKTHIHTHTHSETGHLFRLTHTHTAGPQGGPEVPPCALRMEPRVAATTHPRRESGFPILFYAWWASRRPRQVGPQPATCTCHGASRAGELAAPHVAFSSRTGSTAHPGQRGPRTRAGGRRGSEGGGVRRAGRARPADAEGAARQGVELGRRRRGARSLAPAAGRRGGRERGGESPARASCAPPQTVPSLRGGLSAASPLLLRAPLLRPATSALSVLPQRLSDSSSWPEGRRCSGFCIPASPPPGYPLAFNNNGVARGLESNVGSLLAGRGRKDLGRRGLSPSGCRGTGQCVRRPSGSLSSMHRQRPLRPEPRVLPRLAHEQQALRPFPGRWWPFPVLGSFWDRPACGPRASLQ